MITINDANAAVDMSIISNTEPNERITTLKAQSMEQNDIFFESLGVFCLFFLGVFWLFAL
jgi:hypothetical protein